MSQTHIYGNELCIDFAGDNIEYFENGVKKKGVVCVLTWSASYYTFAIIIPSQSTEHTCLAIGKAIQFFKYIPLVLHSDNAKCFVKSHRKGAEAVFNESYNYFLERIGISSNASNPYSPSEKSCVEAMVGNIQRNVLPRLPREPSLSLEQLNAKLMWLVDKYINKAPFRRGTDKTREYLYKTYEIAKSRKFDGIIPVFYRHISNLRVNYDYRVEIDGVKYSVPYKFASKYVYANIQGKSITILYNGEEIAHHIVSENSKEQIKLEHMPEKHRIVAAKRLKYPTKESILDEATKYGDNLVSFCSSMLNRYGYENGKKGCIRVINLYKHHSTYPKKLLDEAISRLFMDNQVNVNSQNLINIFNEIKSEFLSSGGKLQHQTTLCFSSDPTYTHLRTREKQVVNSYFTVSKHEDCLD